MPRHATVRQLNKNVAAESSGEKVVYHPGEIPDTDRTKPLIRTSADLDRIPRPEHIHAAVAACHTYGQLPISEDLTTVISKFRKEKAFLNSGG